MGVGLDVDMNNTMTRAEFDEFQYRVSTARYVVDDVSVEVNVDGEYEEVFEFPGTMISEEDGDYVMIDDEALAEFPHIAEEYYRVAYHVAEWSAADRATQRAEQGYYDG